MSLALANDAGVWGGTILAKSTPSKVVNNFRGTSLDLFQ